MWNNIFNIQGKIKVFHMHTRRIMVYFFTNNISLFFFSNRGPGAALGIGETAVVPCLAVTGI
jgi:hypothetical protein